jgi:hypothetical protein
MEYGAALSWSYGREDWAILEDEKARHCAGPSRRV